MTTTNPDWQLRSYREGDIPSLVALINSTVEIDGFGQGYSEEDLAASYAQPSSDPATQVVLVEGPHIEGVPEGAPAGQTRLLTMDDPDADERLYQMGLMIHPAARGMGLEPLLVSRAMEMLRANEARADLPVRSKISMFGMAFRQDPLRPRIYNQLGLPDVRHLWTMERPLDEPLPEPKEIENISFRAYHAPEDNAAGCDAYNNSFIDHFEFHQMTQEHWDHMVSRPSARPDLSWVAVIETGPDAGKIAGFCICEVEDFTNEQKGVKEGWIAELGVIRGWRGIGLGRSLLLRGMQSILGSGFDTAMLGVDTQNPSGATGLYASVGFKVREELIMYKSPVSELHPERVTSQGNA